MMHLAAKLCNRLQCRDVKAYHTFFAIILHLQPSLETSKQKPVSYGDGRMIL